MDANPLDPRFGRCPSSTASATASRREPDHTSFLAAAAAAAAAAPPARGYHRRAHSETFIRLPDDFLLDAEPDFGIADIEFPSLSDENGSSSGMFAPVEAQPKVEPETGKGKPIGGAHLRSLSVDTALYEGLGFQVEQGCGEVGGNGAAVDGKVSHRHSSSMDGSTSPFEAESAPSKDFTKKAMAADKLAELALLDPKRAKRILANRQSAARSKERKIRYMSELERKVQTLQTEATTLSAQLTLLQRDTADLTAENKELKLRLQAMEQQAHLRDALNEALRDEVQRLKMATGQIPAVNGNNFNRGLQQPAPQYFPHPQQMNNVGAGQAQQQPQQLHASLHPSPNNQQLGAQSPVDSMDFM